MGRDKSFLQILVEWISLEYLLAAERRLVNDKLIKIYAKNIKSILTQAP